MKAWESGLYPSAEKSLLKRKILTVESTTLIVKKMSRTKELWEEWRELEVEYLRNKRLSLYRWYGEFTNKELNDSGWDTIDD